MIDDLWQDIRYCIRSLRSRPGFTFATILLLTLAVGTNVTLFSFVDALLFGVPRHVADPERLVRVSNSWVLRYDRFTTLQENVSLVSLAAHSNITPLSLGSGVEAEPVQVRFVSHNYLPVLGTRPASGRNFSPEEDAQTGSVTVAILGHQLWHRSFDGDPAVIGTTVRIANRICTIIGIAPEGFSGVDMDPVDVWLPAGSESMVPGGFRIVGRLAAGASIDQARAALLSQYPVISEAPVIGQELELAPVHEGFTTRLSNLHLLVVCLLGAGVVLLLIACTNVSSMLVSHVSTRRHEIAIRMQLGAGRKRIVRQLFTEILVLAGACSVTSLLAAYWTAPLLERVLVAPIPGRWENPFFPRILSMLEPRLYADSILSVHIVAATVCFTLVCAVLCAAGPAFYLGKSDLSRWLKTQHGADPRQSRLRAGLVVLQVALTLLLMVSSGLFGRSFLNAISVDLGIDHRNVLVATADAWSAGHRDADLLSIFDEMTSTMRNVPQVTHVSWSFTIPTSRAKHHHAFTIPGYQWPWGEGKPAGEALVFVETVSPEYFEMLGMKILQGRGFTEADNSSHFGGLVVDEKFARDYFPGESPLGQCVEFRGTEDCRPIVGVVSSVRIDIIRRWEGSLEDPGVYSLVGLGFPRHILIRTDGDPGPLMTTIRGLLQNAAPNVPYVTLERLSTYRDAQTHGWRAGASLFGAFGMLAIAVAMAGIYALLALAVRQRNYEIGVRLAVGAGPQDILRLLLRAGMKPVIIGIGIGTAGALGLTRLMTAMLFGVTATDPASIAGAALLVFLAGVAACTAPARRASRIDPAISLRAE